MQALRTVGLVTENSPAYIQKIFSLWQQGVTVVALRSKGDPFRIQATGATEVQTVETGSGWLSTPYRAVPADVPAQVMFTSGTEGEPKAVWLSHRNLADTVERLNRVMQVTSEIREYVGVPVYHSFGFGRCRAVLAAGGQAFIPARGFNPVEINAMLERGEINAISAVPSLWRILMQSGVVTAAAAQRVRWIEIGSQYMPAEEKIALRQFFNKAVIVQHYGLTEASRSTFLQIHSATPAQLESVGQAFGMAEVAISSSGRIILRGPHVAPKALGADGWLHTSDLGHLENGFLYYEGRADDIINCGGLKLSPDALERSIVRRLNTGPELAVCRVPDAMRGDGILVVAGKGVKASDEELLQATTDACAELGVSARDATHLMRVAQIERTENGKVRRQNMAQQYADRQPQAPTCAIGMNPGKPGDAAQQQAGSLRSQLGAILGVRAVGDQDTFVNLGGDSLSYIQASIALEKQLGFLPPAWEQMPVAQLEALQPQHSKRSQIEPSVILRALAIISVVMNHAGVFKAYFAIDGAAFMLLLPAGYSFARFQLQRVIDSGLARMALVALPRVIVPTVLLLGLQQLRHRHLDISTLLLFHNYTGNHEVFSYWFIEVFVQVHLILAALLCLAPVRAALRGSPWASSMVALVASALVSVLVPLVWNTDHLYNLVPHKVMWYFFMGWCLLFASSPAQRWANAACIAVIAVVLSNGQLPPDSQSIWVLFGGLFLNWAPTFKLPTPLVKGISAVASASLYIYVSHFLVQEPAGRLLPAAGPLGQSVVAIVAGLVFWLAFEKAWQLAHRLLQRRRTAG